MAVITASALGALLRGIAEHEMVFVRTADSAEYVFHGRVLRLDGADRFDIEAEDGEVVYRVPVHGIQYIDVRPFRRYTGYGAADFIREVGPGVSG